MDLLCQLCRCWQGSCLSGIPWAWTSLRAACIYVRPMRNAHWLPLKERHKFWTFWKIFLQEEVRGLFHSPRHLLRGAKMRSVLPANAQTFIIPSFSLLCPDEQWVNNVDSWHIFTSTWLGICWYAWGRESSWEVCPAFCKYGHTLLHALTCDLYFQGYPSDHN